MLKIAICDDNNCICLQVEKIILDYETVCMKKIDITTFSTGESLIDFIRNEHSFDLIFLDIELGSITGMEIGATIRDELDDYISKIVFITSKNGYESSLFDIQPLNFIRKPIEDKKIYKCIDLTLKLLGKENKVFEYKKDYDIIKI